MAVTLFAMPLSSVLLMFSAVLGLANASPYVLPTQTAVYIAHEWSPRPTGQPEDPAELFKRGGSVDIAVCGWVGGQSASSAVCSAGSSCVHDTAHQVMGCCATEGPCTDGVYTACVDKKSPGWASTTSMINNGVTTCAEDSICYQNTYPGNYVQHVCGASSAPAQIFTTFGGQPPDMRMQLVYTGVVFSPMAPAAGPVTLSGVPVSASAPAPAATQPNAFATNIGGAVGQMNPVMATPSASASSAPGKSANPGAIAGGTAGAVAFVTIAVLASVFCWRRRQKPSEPAPPQELFDPSRKNPFAPRQAEPVQHFQADEVVSPMSGMREVFAPFPGRPDTAASGQNPFHYDTAYRNSVALGMAEGQNRSSFSTVAGGNPFADEEARNELSSSPPSRDPPLGDSPLSGPSRDGPSSGGSPLSGPPRDGPPFGGPPFGGPLRGRDPRGAPLDGPRGAAFNGPPSGSPPRGAAFDGPPRGSPPRGFPRGPPRGNPQDRREKAESRYYDDNHPFADTRSLHDSPRLVDDSPYTDAHPFADVAASNPFEDTEEHDTVTAPGGAQQSLRPLSSRQPSIRTMTSEQTQPLVDEIDDFSRSWQASAASHRDPSEQSDYEDDSDKVVQTAMSVSVAHGHLISTRSYEALSHAIGNPHRESPQLINLGNETPKPNSRPTSLNHPTLLPSAAEIPRGASPTSMRSPTPTTMQERIQLLAQEKAQVVRQRTESQEQRREEVEMELQKAQRERATSGASGYTETTLVQPSLLSPGLPPTSPARTHRRSGSFGLNGAIKPVLDDLGGSPSWDFGWSGIGGGWLEGQSGQSVVGEDNDGQRSSMASSSLAPVARKPIGGSSLSMNVSAELPDTPERAHTPSR